ERSTGQARPVCDNVGCTVSTRLVAPFLWKIKARELTDMPKPAIDSASVDAPVKEERSIFEAGQPEPTEMPPHSGIILGIILVSYFMIVLNNSIIFTGLHRSVLKWGYLQTVWLGRRTLLR